MRIDRAALFSIPLLSLTSLPTLAGGCYHGCARETAVAVEPVVVRPAHTEFVREPAVMGTRTQRVEAAPGYWTATKVPAQYGTWSKSVMVQPGMVEYKVIPAQFRNVRETVAVQTGHERRSGGLFDRRGHDGGRGCHFHCGTAATPVAHQTVERQVMVAPAHTVAVSRPAVYRQVTMPVQLAPARVSYQYTPPQYAYVDHPVTLRAAGVRAIHHPAVVAHHRVAPVYTAPQVHVAPARIHVPMAHVPRPLTHLRSPGYSYHEPSVQPQRPAKVHAPVADVPMPQAKPYK